ncbi:hypothetical protein [Natronosalvus halobius]|uniref:hypothetical protein n=1 Tax=Natronosalvus halobius TaxID=2953746 RepID=UPI00209FA139|nr:hypothetical protein [Natronosalvus halobius]USZ71893.1 hypothetical protein NGM15_00875 [Natronosalvus halobius]
MSEIYLVSTLLMGLIVLGAAAVLTRMGQRATPSGHAGTRSGYAEWSPRTATEDSRVVALAKTPAVWALGFVATAVALLGGAVLVVSEGEYVDSGLVEPIVFAVGGAALIGYVFFGAYFAARDRFGNTAMGVAFATLTLGVLGLIAVAVLLLMG